MTRFIQRCALLLVLSLTLTSCDSTERNVSVSQRFAICAQLPDKALHLPTARGASDFEVTELRFGATRGTIYVGDFPDFPNFNPDLKFYEGAGEVRYIGDTEKLGIQHYLYRVGLGSRASVHVLVQIPATNMDFNKSWKKDAKKRIVVCD